ncbi:MAG: M1 family aminopeptidase [Archangium sp.]|nr:M1 family aminopeptidase [Archangium sp.]
MHRIDEPHPFSLETATLHYAEDRAVAAQHLALELDLDFEKHALSGVATHSLIAMRNLKQVSFDAVDLEVSRVEVDGKAVEFDGASGRSLTVHLARALKPDARFEVRIHYRATPQRGLYFVGKTQAWTQGQDIDSRHYFPCLDTPAQKCSSEVKATFPKAMTALSNGALQSDTVKGNKRTMHYRLDAPHAPYLVTLVVGSFEVHEAKSGSTTIRTFFPPGRKDDALRCVSRTPKMVAFFERLTGMPYAFGDYAQIFVSEFIFGGMENTSATTLTDAVLHDARAHADYSAEFLIAHELAHQWFGDLLTCRDWPHGWLNEGFATYSEVLWKEEGESLDEADQQRKLDLDAYLTEVGERYARPIVARKFDAPIDLFDRHLYEKGALVLHELRCRLGDDDFFASVREYVAAHAHGSVETVDLARAVERITGRNVDRFFDEYVHRAGHPQLKVEVRYEAEKKAVRLSVKQAQEGDAYALSLPVHLVVGDKASSHAFALTQKEHVFFLPAAREPSQVIVDARRELLATLEVEKPVGLWRAELLHAEIARARTEAANALAKDPAGPSVAALAKVLKQEGAFWGTRAACAKTLGLLRSPAARTALIDALKVKAPKARRAVVAALGQFRDDAEAGEALTALAKKGDPSGFVEGEAARSLGKVHAKGAFELLTSMLERPAFQDAVRCGALDGFAELRDPRAWKHVLAALVPGQPVFGRRTAVLTLAKLAEAADKKTEAVDRIGQLLRDENFRVRLSAIDAASTLGDERIIGALSTTPFLDGREQRLAREAIRALRARAPGKELAALRGDLDKVKGDLRALQESVERKK